jgi:L-malate glycosyltransferase
LTKSVHQFLATFELGAIGSDALAVQQALRDAGYQSEIFAEYVRAPFEEMAQIHTAYGSKIKAEPSDVLIYHMALGSNVADWLAQRSEPLLLRHHNITPVEYYSPWPDANTYGMAWGRHQLRELVGRTAVGCGVSEFNRRELEALHYKRTFVTPLLLDFEQFNHTVDADALARLQRGAVGATWLFVGWVAPHKCQHEIIKAFSLYKRLYDPDARLFLVGRAGLESYWSACEKLIVELGLQDSVVLTGRVSDGELGAYYRAADALVCMSEHEGVGIPLLEAMYHDVPVVAFANAAVPETVGDAGVLLSRKRPATVAAAVNRVMSDESLRDGLVQRGRNRLRVFSRETAAESLLNAVAQASSARP